MTSQQQIDSTDLRVQVDVDVPIEAAFRVFTERMHSWWPSEHRLGAGKRTAVVMEQRVGGRWYEQTSDDAECAWGQVLARDPPAHIAVSWQLSPSFAPEPDPARASRLDIRFVSSGPRQTTVTLEHSGIERHGEGWEQMKDRLASDTGWPDVLGSYAVMASRWA